MKAFYKGLVLGLTIVPLSELISESTEAVTALFCAWIGKTTMKYNTIIGKEQAKLESLTGENKDTVVMGFQPMTTDSDEEIYEEEDE